MQSRVYSEKSRFWWRAPITRRWPSLPKWLMLYLKPICFNHERNSMLRVSEVDTTLYLFWKQTDFDEISPYEERTSRSPFSSWGRLFIQHQSWSIFMYPCNWECMQRFPPWTSWIYLQIEMHEKTSKVSKNLFEIVVFLKRN